MIRTAVWGTGNVGRAAIRAVDAHPDLVLTGVIVKDPRKVGRDAGELADLDLDLGVAATDDVAEVLSADLDALVYSIPGESRPQDALADITKVIRTGAVVVTPSLYPLFNHRVAPSEFRDPVLAAIAAGNGSLFVSGVDPGWGNDVLPLMISGLASTVDVIRCQGIFDYSTYAHEPMVRDLIGMGQPLDYAPPMVEQGMPTTMWGGQIRMIATALGIRLDEIAETVDRRKLDTAVTTARMGTFEAGTQGALKFEVQGIVDGSPRIVVEHVTRIHPDCAPEWASSSGSECVHRVVIEGRPRIEVTIEATDEGGSRVAGGTSTAVGRIVNAIDWLVEAPPGIYDALDVPLRPAVGKLAGARGPMKARL